MDVLYAIPHLRFFKTIWHGDKLIVSIKWILQMIITIVLFENIELLGFFKPVKPN